MLLELATAEGLSFEVDLAATHARAAFAAAADREERLQCAMLASSLSGHHAGAAPVIELLREVGREFADQPGMAASIEAQITNVARFESGARRDVLSRRELERALRS